MNKPQARPLISDIAAREFAARQASARRKVAQNKLAPLQAAALLGPWLALACRAGANLPEFADALDALREPMDDGRSRYSESQMRALVADDICPRPAILAALATARDRAIELAEGDAARAQRARELMLLSFAFAAPATRLRPLPASTRPTAERECAA